MKKFKPTKEFMCTPRPCVHCGQWMSEEFLIRRRYKRIENLEKALKDYHDKKKKLEAERMVRESE